MTFTHDEQWALERLAIEVERGEYADDRNVQPVVIGWQGSEPITRPYQAYDAIRHAEAVMRQDSESTMGGWS
jgi:hypothetical protein